MVAVAKEAAVATVATLQVASWQWQGGNNVVVVMMSAVAMVASMEASQLKMHQRHQRSSIAQCSF